MRRARAALARPRRSWTERWRSSASCGAASRLPAAEGAPTAAETAAAIEELTRAILRDAACGHLGGDLRATADEILLADGLAVGEGEAEQRGGSEEWDLPDDEPDDADGPQDDP